ncbi:hypothetical protein UCD39_20905 [Nitrospirillum sp. BR 11752]|uniref:hypothetical protein n=1 Tax=Nitrospirillum sp. BR 11752 TaxID=3104293 RepID=UPI002EA926C8|nr:hypothetical protein [Nitrospirillum sp. BR 11752]
MEYWNTKRNTPHPADTYADRLLESTRAFWADGFGIAAIDDSAGDFTFRHISKLWEAQFGLFDKDGSNRVAGAGANLQRELNQPTIFPTVALAAAAYPWLSTQPGKAVLFSASFAGAHEFCRVSIKRLEEELNPVFPNMLAWQIREKITHFSANAPLPRGNGCHLYYAPTGSIEKYNGADLGIVAHVNVDGADRFRTMLFQAKNSGTQTRWRTSVGHFSGNERQLHKLVETGMGYYVFWHQDQCRPICTPTVRSADDIKKEVDETGIWTVDTVLGSWDFATFLISHALTSAQTGLLFDTAPQAVEALVGCGYDVANVLAVSADGNMVAFQELRRAVEAIPWLDHKHSIAATTANASYTPAPPVGGPKAEEDDPEMLAWECNRTGTPLHFRREGVATP